MSTIQDQLVQVNCPLCRSGERRLLGTEDGLGIVRCLGCGIFYVSPRRIPSDKFEGSAQALAEKYAPILSGQTPHPLDARHLDHLKHIRRFKPPGELLDVGCGGGFFLRLAAKEGWKAKGVEPHSGRAELARTRFGLDVFKGFLNDAPFVEHSFDVVTALDVIEHLYDPISLLRQVHRFLKPDGLLMLKTPNGDYTYWKWKWYQRLHSRRRGWEVHEHVVQFTRPTLLSSLAQTQFRVVEWIAPKPYPGPQERWRIGFLLRESIKQALFYSARRQQLAGSSTLPLPDLQVLARPI